ncbi:hypothetical protein WMY93_021603 [Mugilogobius chulae]|uniref:Helically-extended SH3 domain-containing protein n=1 Tax=Mugilogobius chulae TaxID=88201 RepID=A0AAW0NIA7_9GOBI
MENKADVKAIMARFQANGSTSEDPPSATSPGRPKIQTKLSSEALFMKKPTTDSGASIPPKPSYIKNTPNLPGKSETPEPSKAKALANKFANSQEETKPPFDKNKLPTKPSFMQLSEPKAALTDTKPVFPKPGLSKAGTEANLVFPKPGLNVTDAKLVFPKPGLNGTEVKPVFPKPGLNGTDAKPVFPKPGLNGTDAKPAFPKPSLNNTVTEPKPVFTKLTSPKPNWIKEDSVTSSPAEAPPTLAPKIPPTQLKPSNNFFKLQQKMEANIQHTTKAEVSTDNASRPTLPVMPAAKPTPKNPLFNKEPAEQDKPSAVNKLAANILNSVAPTVPPASKKPSLRKPSPRIQDGDPNAPKKNPLPNSLALGPAPAKPNRPPNVNLSVIKRETDTPADEPKKIVPPPPPSHPSNHSNPVTPAPPPVPSLPRETQNPFHPSQMSKDKDEDDDDDGEMYEDLDERWEAAEQKQEKKKEKDDKEEKKRLEAEKKEQKEREKKEQEARKKFKLVGPRLAGHHPYPWQPEGKWLARAQDGSIGYVKIPSVKIDYNSLKQTAEQAYEPDVYDDIDTAPPEKSKAKEVAFPPPPVIGGEEIYDDVDQVVDVSSSEAEPSPVKPRVFQWMLERSKRAPSNKVLPPPILPSGHPENKGGAIDEEIYDDVDQNFPPPPPVINVLKVDPKKQKKLEKEEKEFRKKFKFEGEISVLDQVTIIPNLTNKKWSNKELQLKAGEKLDVIVKAVDNKLICRNEDGKFGYVSTSYIVSDDGDIYDDIGDGDQMVCSSAGSFYGKQRFDYLKPIAEEERKVEEAEKKLREEQSVSTNSCLKQTQTPSLNSISSCDLSSLLHCCPSVEDEPQGGTML